MNISITKVVCKCKQFIGNKRFISSNLYNFIRMSSFHSQPKRYFINSMPDYVTGQSHQADDLNYKARIEEIADLIWQKTSNRSGSNDTYVGKSGIAYMFWYLAQQQWLFNEEQRRNLINKARHYITDVLNNMTTNDRTENVAFLLGNAGVLVVASLIFNALGDLNKRDQFLNDYLRLSEFVTPVSYLRKGSDELLVGRAGYVCGALILNKTLNNPQIVPPKVLQNLAVSTVKSGITYSKEHKSSCPLMYSYYDTEYLGAGHGLAGILQGLLSTPNVMQLNPDFEPDIKNSIDYLLSLQTSEGNFPCAIDELGHHRRHPEDELVHWCHGAPGVVWLMAKAYLLWKEPKYLESVIKSGELMWRKGLLRKGPGICHGVSGNGYVFLLLYRLTQDEKYLFRAKQFAKFMFSKEFTNAKVPDTPYSLFEGWSGTVCYLVDVLKPDQALFPLYFDIFND